MKSFPSKLIERLILFLVFGFMLYRSCVEFYAIGSGTGEWYADFSLTWYLLFWIMVALCVGLLALCGAALWFPERLKRLKLPLQNLRELSNLLRWVVGLFFLVLPLVIFQFTVLGVVLSGYYIRLLIVTLCTVTFAFFFTRSDTDFITWESFFVSIFLFSAVITITARFTDVLNYPFSLGWSEGNRLWDYSTLFGRDRYIYPADVPLTPYLDFGRQLIGGLGFLWPGLTIAGARFWVDFTTVFPYLLLGWVLFKSSEEKDGWSLLAMGGWTFLFLGQTSVHPPLLVSAILLVLVWRRSLWVAIPVIITAAYFAAISRFTWTFAIAIWAVMLEFGMDKLRAGNVEKQTWVRSILVGLAGIFGGFVLPKIVGVFQGQYDAGVSAAQITAHLNLQPLLWYRLLPNATYDEGVLLGMLKVALPLIVVLIYLNYSGRWVLNIWQKLALTLPLFAFLVVGLIVSTKVGGGGDLHNLDMFFIGLLFVAVIAWFNGGRQWVRDVDAQPFFIRLMLMVIMIIPMLGYINWFRLPNYSGDPVWLLTLTGAKNLPGLGFLPEQEETDRVLDMVRSNVASAQEKGEVLFMDQRQLLTFGYIQGVPLIPDYEKKMVMDHAMSQKTDYFAQFYHDLANHRFSLIISDPLRVPVKTSRVGFGEENNAWVDWVARPILCYYEPVETYGEFRVQLLVPRTDAQDCSSELPFVVAP
jgi:hypothetical protein